MHRKLIMSCTVLAALATFVIPPVSYASVLTSEGKPVAAGTEVVGKSTGEVQLTGSSPVICGAATLPVNLTLNSAGNIQGEVPGGGFVVTGTGSGGDCTSALGAVNMLWNRTCIRIDKGSDTAVFSGCGANVTFTTGLTGTGTCKYSSPFIYGTSFTNMDATIKISEQELKLEEGGFICPSSQKLDLDFDLTTLAGGTLVIS